jgi:uncharacterized membrane protein
MRSFKETIEAVGLGVDAAGVAAIVAGVIMASALFVARRPTPADAYRRYRQNLGKAILLGLELLVAGDIIRTVAVAPTMSNVLVLGMIVVIRTLLSITLQVELEGRWPWQRQPDTGSADQGRP